MTTSLRSKFAQFRSVSSLVLINFTSGMCIGWASPALYKLEHAKEDVPFPATPGEASFIASSFDVGILLGTVVGGVIFSYQGRRTTMLMAPIAQILWSLLTYFATSPVYLYVARMFGGTAMAINLMFGGIYIAEVATPDMRGPLTLFSLASLLGGTLLEIAVGPYVSWLTQTVIAIPVPVVGLLLVVFFMQESPYYFAMVNRTDDMMAVLAKLRGDANDDDLKREAAHIQGYVKEQMSSTTSLRETLAQPASRKAALIVLTLSGSTPLFGSAAIMTFAQEIFKETGSPLKDDVSVIVKFGLQLVGYAFSAKLVNSVGRKPLLGVTLLVRGITLGGVAVFLAVQKATHENMSSLSWLPLTCLLLCSLASGVGASPVPEVLAGELLGQRTKIIVAPIASVLVSISAFVINTSFYPIEKSVGLYVLFVLFSVTNLLGAAFAFLVIPETKGKTLAEVQDILRGRTRKERI